jgi:PTS system nitrogen regulatory IIA component
MQLTVRDVVRILGVPEKDVTRWIRQGVLPAYRVQDRYCFNRAEILEWAISRRMPVSEDLLSGDDEDATPLPSLAEALQAGGFSREVGGADRESVLRTVVSALRLPDGVDREFLFRVLLAREALGSTAVGDGVAIPHVRSPVVLHIDRPAVHLSYLARPIDFGAPDGQPVHILFLSLSPTVRVHLHVLARLAFALRDPGFKGILLRRGTDDEILREARRLDAAMPRAAGAASGGAPG